jgi:drug/metabolite transporter (DMT)-like permease
MMLRMLFVLALASAATYGAADFLGGLASRRASAIAIVVVSQCAGLIALLLMLPLLPASSPAASDWIWGAAAGVAGGAGVALLYRALAITSMAIAAPITAVCAVTVPVAVAIALGERPGTGPLAGIALALASIVLVSQQDTREGASSSPVAQGFHPLVAQGFHPLVAQGFRPLVAQGFSPVARAGVGTALASGVAIGLFFLAIARTRAEAGMWPLVAARGVSFVLFAMLAALTKRSLRMSASVTAIAVAGGILDMLANVLYLVASRYGPLSIVVTLSSLYPASTVLLARTVLGERLSALQVIGIICALVAVLLIVGTR